MGKSTRKRLAPLARKLDLKRLLQWSAQPVIFPFYHVVSDWHLPHIRHLYRYRRVDEFRDDLEEMLKWYEPMGLRDYLNLEGGTADWAGTAVALNSGKRRRMVLTFDDGLAECHQTIAPLLKEKGIPAVFFLNNYFIDNRGLFFRYKASLIIDRIISECTAREKAAAYLRIPEEKVADAIRMVRFDQQALLDDLAPKVEIDVADYLRDQPVYMNTQQVMDLVDWGFEVGGHSADHADFSAMGPDEIREQVRMSVEDIKQRFGVTSPGFSFPFTSAGVPEEVIRDLLNEGDALALLGTSGIKRTRYPGFIQRIPMEELEMPAAETLKTELLYFLLKKLLGLNRYRY